LRICGENRAFSIIRQQQRKAEPESEPFSSPVLRSKVRWAWICPTYFILFAANDGVVFKPVTPPGNGNRLGAVQETIQDRARCGRVAQKLAPFLQWSVAGHVPAADP
jgi:hypothetical protein